MPLYAESGVPVVWIVNLKDEEIEVHSNPDGNAYLERRVFRKGMHVSLPYENEGIEVNRIFK